MVTGSKKRKSTGSKKRFIGKPTGQIQERVQAVGPEHFGIIAVDCAKRRSKWMLCNFYGKVLIEPTTVEHTAGGLRVMTQQVAEACQAEGLTDTVVAVEMTGIYHKPVYRAFRKAGFDTRRPTCGVCPPSLRVEPFPTRAASRRPRSRSDLPCRSQRLWPGHVADRRSLSVVTSGLASPA